jgi:hypothetical protein
MRRVLPRPARPLHGGPNRSYRYRARAAHKNALPSQSGVVVGRKRIPEDIQGQHDRRSHKGGLPLDAAAAGMPKDLGKRIERWAKAMGKDSHSDAMRHLLEIGLSAKKKR